MSGGTDLPTEGFEEVIPVSLLGRGLLWVSLKSRYKPLRIRDRGTKDSVFVPYRAALSSIISVSKTFREFLKMSKLIGSHAMLGDWTNARRLNIDHTHQVKAVQENFTELQYPST